jgi:hypothetical protein
MEMLFNILMYCVAFGGIDRDVRHSSRDSFVAVEGSLANGGAAFRTAVRSAKALLGLQLVRGATG